MKSLQALESLPAGTAVLELPLGNLVGDLVAMYRGTYHGRPVINGYSGFFPLSYVMLRGRIDVRDPQAFDAITAWGPWRSRSISARTRAASGRSNWRLARAPRFWEKNRAGNCFC